MDHDFISVERIDVMTNNRPVFTLDEVLQHRSVALVGVSAENWMSNAAFALMYLKDEGFPAIYP